MVGKRLEKVRSADGRKGEREKRKIEGEREEGRYAKPEGPL